MREFFHGWRRKLGVMTLVMACVGIVMLVRSRTVLDQILLRVGQTTYTIASVGDKVEFEIFADLRSESERQRDRKTDCFPIDRDRDRWLIDIGYSSDDLAKISKYISPALRAEGGNPFRGTISNEWAIEWRLAWAGFRFQQIVVTDEHKVEIYLLPYWSIVVPLTLLSAYLLLSKPRKPTTVPTDEVA